jgi:hypothetical protein
MTTDAQVNLSFEQTVPRAIAHRRAVGEVFVTDSAQVAEDDFMLAVQIPRAHSLWADRTVPFHDPLATGEAARQGSFVVLHRYLEVPLDLPFSMQHYELAVDDLTAYRDGEQSPLQGVLCCRLRDKKILNGELGSLRIEGELMINGIRAMRIGGHVVFLSRVDYQELRAFQRSRKPIKFGQVPERTKPLDASAVGRVDQRNVVIGAPITLVDGVRYPLVIDQRHPTFFDHSYDHVPGPLCVEGFRQVAIVTAHEYGAIESPVVAMTGCKVSFADFGEFEETLYYSAKVVDCGEQVTVRVGLHQFGRQLVSGHVQLRPYPAEVSAHDSPDDVNLHPTEPSAVPATF